MFEVFRIGADADDEVVGPGAHDVTRLAIEFEVDCRDKRAVFVGGGDEPAIDLAIVGLVGVAAHHDIDGAVEFFYDIDDWSRDARAFIIIADRNAALVDQHNDGLDAASLQFRNQRIDRFGLVAELEAGCGGRRNDVSGALERQADEGDGDAFELTDLVGREQRLAGRFLEGRGVVKPCSGETMRPQAFVDRVTAAILHPQQFVLALVELVIADGGDLKPHHRKRFDGRLVVEHRRQERAGADQVAGCNKHRVRVAPAELFHQGCHGLRAAGRNRNFLAPVVGIGNPDAARRRVGVAMEIVDRENP